MWPVTEERSPEKEISTAFLSFLCEEPVSFSQWLTKQLRQRMKGKKMAESVCFLVLGHDLFSLVL